MKNFIKTYENGINFDENMEKHPQTILPLDGMFFSFSFNFVFVARLAEML